MNYNILNSKEKKEVSKAIESQWGISALPDYVFLEKRDGKLFIINREVELILGKRIFIDAMGIYIAEFNRERGEIRLSIEGAQLLFPHATKNVVEIDDSAARRWLKGEDIDVKKGDYSGFVIVRSGNDILGSGKYRDGTVLNFVPKTRRILAQD